MLNIEQQKAREILKALIYREMVDDTNKESVGEKIIYDKPLIKEFAKFCGLSEDTLEDLYDEVFENIDEFENNTFWENFSEKVAIVKREEEVEEKGVKFSQDEAFVTLCRYMDQINDRLQDVDLINLWKYIAVYFKTKPAMETNGKNGYQSDKKID